MSIFSALLESGGGLNEYKRLREVDAMQPVYDDFNAGKISSGDVLMKLGQLKNDPDILTKAAEQSKLAEYLKAVNGGSAPQAQQQPMADSAPLSSLAAFANTPSQPQYGMGFDPSVTQAPMNDGAIPPPKGLNDLPDMSAANAGQGVQQPAPMPMTTLMKAVGGGQSQSIPSSPLAAYQTKQQEFARKAEEIGRNRQIAQNMGFDPTSPIMVGLDRAEALLNKRVDDARQDARFAWETSNQKGSGEYKAQTDDYKRLQDQQHFGNLPDSLSHDIGILNPRLKDAADILNESGADVTPFNKTNKALLSARQKQHKSYVDAASAAKAMIDEMDSLSALSGKYTTGNRGSEDKGFLPSYANIKYDKWASKIGSNDPDFSAREQADKHAKNLANARMKATGIGSRGGIRMLEFEASAVPSSSMPFDAQNKLIAEQKAQAKAQIEYAKISNRYGEDLSPSQVDGIIQSYTDANPPLVDGSPNPNWMTFDEWIKDRGGQSQPDSSATNVDNTKKMPTREEAIAIAKQRGLKK